MGSVLFFNVTHIGCTIVFLSRHQSSRPYLSTQDRDRKLRIFPGSEHPFGDKPLEPYVMPPRQVRELRPRARRAMIRAQKKSEQQQGGGNIVSKGKMRDEASQLKA